MPLVRVYNDNSFPYKEKYQGRLIEIPPKDYIEMDHNEAAHFMGIMPPNIQFDANGKQTPETFKWLRVETKQQREILDAEAQRHAEETKWLCNACGKNMHTQEAYEAHVEAQHLHQMVDEDAREALVKKRGRPAKVVKDDTDGD